MVWISTSRLAAAGAGASTYGEIDLIVVSLGAASGIAGVILLSWRKSIDIKVKKALSDGHEAYQKGDWEDALSEYSEALLVEPDSKIAKTCKADVLSQKKKYDKAMKVYDSVLIKDPEFSPAIMGKGSALRLRGDIDKSIVYLQKALSLDPDSKVAWNNKGNTFFHAGKLDTAIYCYKKAIESDPSYSGAWYNMAVALTNSGKFLEADHAFRTATQLIERKTARPTRTSRSTRTIKDISLPEFFHLEFLTGDSERSVLDHLSYHPGEDLDTIAREMVMTEAETKAILARLVKSGFLKPRKDGAVLRYYPRKALPIEFEVAEMVGGTEISKKLKYLTDVQRAIIGALSTEEGMTIEEIAAMMELSPQVVEFHTRTLLKGGVIERRKESGKDRYFAMGE
jgi:tetratricopeptide (TPR) repeat protein